MLAGIYGDKDDAVLVGRVSEVEWWGAHVRAGDYARLAGSREQAERVPRRIEHDHHSLGLGLVFSDAPA